MKNFILTTILILSFAIPNYAQYTTVTYDVDRNWFNEGQSLPAEKSMVIKGIMPKNMQLIEMNILSAKRSDFLYKGEAVVGTNGEFLIPINYKLRSSDKYDFRFDFFQTLSENDKTKAGEQLFKTLETYFAVNFTGEKSLKLLKKSKHTIKEMNELVANHFAQFRSKTANWNPTFSEVVRLKLEQIDKADLDKGYSKKDSTTNKATFRAATKSQLINELQQQVKLEIAQMLNQDLYILADSRMIDNYETEKKENGLAINVGYGGVYFSGKLEDANYDAAPYVGLAFPLGNSVLGSKFLSNSSINIGFFLENFEDEKGGEVTGFLVNRPIYVGLDHKIFKFIHFNAGAAFLESPDYSTNNNPDLVTDTKVIVRPYVGLSARINLSIGLGK